MMLKIIVRDTDNCRYLFIATQSISLFIQEARKIYKNGGYVVTDENTYEVDIVSIGYSEEDADYASMTWTEFTSLADIFN